MNVGSKTPLSYVDFFYITTIFEGLEYQYVYHKGDKLPTIESLLGYTYSEIEVMVVDQETLETSYKMKTIKHPIGQPTEKHNGTTIKINIENDDLYTFTDNIKTQLTYFDNVYFDNWNVPNKYVIYEGEHFKFRSDVTQVYTDVHICVGKVRYSLDSREVDIPPELKSAPVAVKFDIGELDITPNRESLRYTAETKSLVNARLLLALEELQKLHAEQAPLIEDFETYIDSGHRNVDIVLDKEKGHKIEVWRDSGLTAKFKFKPVYDTGLKTMPTSFFFHWEIVGSVNYDGTFSASTYDRTPTNRDMMRNTNFVIMEDGDKISKYTNIKILQELGGCSKLIRRKKLRLSEYDIHLKLGNSKKESKKARRIYDYKKAINAIVLANSKGSYQDFRADDEWIANYNKTERENTLAYKRKMQQKIFVRTISEYGTNGTEVKLSELHNRTGILVYGFREDQSKLQAIYRLFEDLVVRKGPKRNDFYSRRKAFLVLQVSKDAEKKILSDKNHKTIYWEDFLKTKFVRKFYNLSKLRTEVDAFDDSFNTLTKRMAYGLNKSIDKLRISACAISATLAIRVDDLIRGTDIEIKEISEMFTEIRSVREKFKSLKQLPLSDYIKPTIDHEEDPLKEYTLYVKSKGYRLNNLYYLKTKSQLRFDQGIRVILDIIRNPNKQVLLLTQNTCKNEQINNEEDSSESSTSQENSNESSTEDSSEIC